MIIIDGNNMSIDDIWNVAVNREKVILDEATKEKVVRSSQIVSDMVEREEIQYGITTGFGAFCKQFVNGDRAEELQRNFLLSHAVGVGRPLPKHVVRATLLIRVNTLCKGFSGVRYETLQTLCLMLNRDVYPFVPCQGSVGSSGDLAPLAHIGLVVIGMGEAFVEGKRVPGNIALEKAGISPLKLGPKEGLSLANGTNLMTALGALGIKRAENLVKMADAICALSGEALGCVVKSFDPRIQDARPHSGQKVTGQNLRRFLKGSALTDLKDKIHDAYAIRCAPQVHGAVRDVIGFVKESVRIEVNSATDNPLIFYNDTSVDVISGGNFHGEPIAFAMDFLGISLSELANISERRFARLIDDKANNDLLPPALIDDFGLNTGFMLAQYTAAALVSENKVLAHPASVDSIPTSLGFEDHVSMGTIAARKATDILENLENVLGLELMAACQAIDYRLRQGDKNTNQMGEGTKLVFEMFREEIPFMECDVYLAPLIEQAKDFVGNAAVLERFTRHSIPVS